MTSENFKMSYKNIFIMRNVTNFHEMVETGMDLPLMMSQYKTTACAVLIDQWHWVADWALEVAFNPVHVHSTYMLLVITQSAKSIHSTTFY